MRESKLRVVSLPIHASGVAYYRHHVPLLALRERGHDIIALNEGLGNWTTVCAYTVAHYDYDYAKYLDGVLSKGVDVIHAGWSNNLTHTELLVAMREKYRVPLVIDYDDDILHVDQYNMSYRSYHEGAFSRKVARLGMRVADSVSVSTAPLKEALKDECRHIDVLPNYTHPPHWQDAPVDPRRSEDKSVRVMFAGGPSHLGDLTQVKDAVEWALGHYDGKEGRPHVKFIFVACMPDWAAKWISDAKVATHNRVFFVQGTDEDTRLWQRVIKWVAPDVLMAPLLHNDFNKSKSLIKAYDAAMVEGCAFVCEDWPTYGEVPFGCAYKVDSQEVVTGWQQALGSLIENGDQRHELSTNLHQWVLDKRTISNHICQWERVYEQALARPVVSQLSDVVRPAHLYDANGNLLDA